MQQVAVRLRLRRLDGRWRLRLGWWLVAALAALLGWVFGASI